MAHSDADEQTLPGNEEYGNTDTADAITLNGTDPSWPYSTAPLTAHDLYLLEKEDLCGWFADTAQNPPSVKITADSRPVKLPKKGNTLRREIYTVNYEIDPTYRLTLTNSGWHQNKLL